MTAPGTGVVVEGVLVMVSAGVSTGTLTEQAAGRWRPVGQLLPGAAVVIVLASTWLPVSGLFTVTVPVMVTVPPIGMLPVQVSAVPVMVSVPEVAVWSPSEVASSNTSAALMVIVIPV